MYLLPSFYSRFNTGNIWDEFESLIKAYVYKIVEEFIYSFSIVISLLEIIKMISKI